MSDTHESDAACPAQVSCTYASNTSSIRWLGLIWVVLGCCGDGGRCWAAVCATQRLSVCALPTAIFATASLACLASTTHQYGFNAPSQHATRPPSTEYTSADPQSESIYKQGVNLGPQTWDHWQVGQLLS